MLITRVDLENVKSYREQSVAFTHGTNAICGANGAGKSTLLEAIGFALVDALPYTQEQFVREGEKVATVTVHLEGSDGRAYQVVRRCGSYKQYYVYDPELDGKVVDGKSDTTEWLYAFFGVEETGDLSALFQDAVGVPQGLLTAAFMDRPGNRKNTFNPLLRVDEYEKVWQALLGPRRRLEEWIAEQENAIAGHEAETKALTGWQEKAAALEGGIATDRERHAELEAELEQVMGQRSKLEEVKGRLEALDRQADQADAAVQGIEGRLEDARAAVERAEKAQRVVQETEAGHQAYLEAQRKLAVLEGQRQERDALKESLQTHNADLRLMRSQLQGLESDLHEIGEAEKEVARLRPQVAEQERLEKALEGARIDAERLAQATRSLSQARTHLAELEDRLSKAQAGLQERAEVEKAIEPLRKEVDALDDQHNALSKQQATHQTELGQIDERADRARERLANAEATLQREKRDLADLRQKLEKMDGGLETRGRVEKEIESLQQELQRAQSACRELDAQLVTHQAEGEQNQAQIDVLEVTEAAECPVCHEPLTPEHRVELLAEGRTRQDELEAALVEARSRRQEAEETRRQQRGALDDREKQRQTLPRPSDREALAASVQTQQDRVAASETVAADAQTEVSGHEGRHKELEEILSALLDQWDEMEEERRQKHKALEALEGRLRALPRVEEVASHAADVSKQQGIVAEWIQAVEAVYGAPEKVQRLEAQLQQVGDPRSSYRSAADTAAKRSQVEEEREEVELEIADLCLQIRALEEQLGAFAGLDAQLAQERAREGAHEAAHQRYLEHVREAEALEERTERAASLDKELKTAQGAHRRLVEARDRVVNEYDAGAYASLVDRQSTLSDERAKLNERLRLQQEQLAEAEAEVVRLSEVQKALVAARGERDELQEVQSLLETLRHVLRDAGPKITQAMVEVISLQAARMYADIMADHSARLRWTDDYEILLAASGRERTFKQLSGGEQMAAALATRLALLREVSDIDVAFFDEPTANLDEARRDNLAEQIMHVKGFSQLFVISHDDTFERDTDNVVRVVKENGVSRAGPESVERVEG